MRLGVGDEERLRPQVVEVDVSFFFPRMPAASQTDEGDFVCYGEISHSLKEQMEPRSFRLIEYLGAECFKLVRAQTPEDVKITLRLTKCEVPVSFVVGDASFTLTDLPPFAWTPPL